MQEVDTTNAEATNGSPAPPRVLIVDDNTSSRRLLAAALKSAGFTALQAADGSDALAAIARMPPDVVLLDLEMPGLTGTETCERIREHSDPRVRELPVVMLTAHDSEEEEVRCLKAGANDFLAKPVGRAALTARIQTQLRLRAMGTELRTQNEELAKWRATHEADLEAAKTTQSAIIPAKPLALAGWQIETRFTPVIQVGGDVYGWRILGNGRCVVWLADATGHGAAAALFTTLTALLFHQTTSHANTPSEVLREVNSEFIGVFRGRSFMSACCLMLEVDGTVTFSSAGHPPLLVRRAGGEVESIEAASTMLGITRELAPADSRVALKPGDGMLLYTDGLYSLRSPGGEMLTWLAVRNAFAAKLEGKGEIEGVIASLQANSNGTPFDDDLTALALCRVAEPGLVRET
jgi:sigma-B regulation protein RsbU (phosphoserine phosphatase)